MGTRTPTPARGHGSSVGVPQHSGLCASLLRNGHRPLDGVTCAVDVHLCLRSCPGNLPRSAAWKIPCNTYTSTAYPAVPEAAPGAADVLRGDPTGGAVQSMRGPRPRIELLQPDVLPLVRRIHPDYGHCWYEAVRWQTHRPGAQVTLR